MFRNLILCQQILFAKGTVRKGASNEIKHLEGDNIIRKKNFIGETKT